MRILIAEDDFTSRIALAGVLKKYGHEIVETVDGAAAWEVLQKPDAPRLVILDWMMPEMDGIEVLHRVRSLQTERSAYIILLTAKDTKTDIITGLDAGADDYLIKPFNIGELRARIEVGIRMIEMQDTLTIKIEELRRSEEKYRLVFDSANDAIFIHDAHARILAANPLACHRLGYTYTELSSMTADQVDTPEEAQHVQGRIARLKETSQVIFETVHQRKDGSPISTEVSSRLITWDGQPAIMSICRDISARKQIETYKEMGREILQILNTPGSLSDAIHHVLDTLKRRTGFDAVGIRLQNGHDFPYFAQIGFPQDFLLTENTLLGRTADGGLCRDEAGNPMLECTCGLVITGKTPPTSPLFTPGGCFWTNDAARLLELPPSEDPRFQPRNQCIHHGYASVALVPIRNKERIVGLIHYNDRRKECFSPDIIEQLEGVAAHIGAALMRKQAEEALQVERKRLSEIIGFLPDATLAIDRHGQVIIWNQAMEQMTGLSAAEMTGKGDYAYAIPFYGEARPQLIDLVFADNAAIAALYPHIAREGDTILAEVFCKSLYNNQGAWVFAKASPLRDQTGNIIGAIESIRDITASKHNQDKLKKSIAWFKALFNATSDSVMLVKPDGMILDLNEKAASRREICADTMRGQNIFDFLPPDSASIRHRAIEQILQERRLVEYEETRTDKHYRIRLFPVMNAQGEVIQVASFSRDITHSKQTEEENKQLLTQLIQAQKMEAIGTLAGGIAHDFNNILSAILGYAAMAQENIPNESSAAQDLDKVIEAGERAADLVKQILAISRRADIKQVSLEPARIVQEAIKLLRPTLPSTIAISLRIDTNSSILADPTQVHQILMNLCTNAFHAMEQAGGTLEIILTNRVLSPHDLHHHSEVQPGKFVELSIRDSGQGIDPEIRNKIFDPYFTTKALGKGTGLGLAIVHGIIASYGGFITCESEPGKGTIFRAFFPALEQEPTPFRQPVEPVPLGTEHVLLIDDEPLLAEMGGAMLQSLGYEVTVMTSSSEALEAFRRLPDQFDAVITDQTMPGLTGIDLARRMLHVRSDLPIILCTGFSSLINEEQAKGYGVQGFALKPITKRKMATLLRKVLDA